MSEDEVRKLIGHARGEPMVKFGRGRRTARLFALACVVALRARGMSAGILPGSIRWGTRSEWRERRASQGRWKPQGGQA